MKIKLGLNINVLALRIRLLSLPNPHFVIKFADDITVVGLNQEGTVRT